ncbi:hypothetical protein PENNAL_c0048G03258 [Penicillium nalgiovense]|uniref:Uncharacterized protein n=1 Tax=Penicillium nalgiovense TaxID=60175 RepID=A0A1V6XYD0_PENNA|nr:hypothetical protein PENNAL_c0048G03258 [Penicillium nalgiovense]
MAPFIPVFLRASAVHGRYLRDGASDLSFPPYERSPPTASGRLSQGTMNATDVWYQSLFVDREEGDRDQDDEDD